MIIEEIKNIKGDKSDWRKFGITMGIILAVMGFYLLWKGKNYVEYVFSLAAAFFIMTRVIMVFIFYMIVTPVGFVASIIGKNFLDMKIDKTAKSYWVVREMVQKEKSDYERQF